MDVDAAEGAAEDAEDVGSVIDPALYGTAGRRDDGPGVRVVRTGVAGPVLGLGALGTGLAVAELVAGLVRGAPSPVVAAGDTIIDLVPGAVSDWAIATFGSANKVVLVVGTIVVLALAAIALGRACLAGRRETAVVATIVVGALGVVAVTTRSSSSVGHLAPVVVGTVTATLVFWWAPVLLRARGPRVSAAEPAAPVPMGVDRRRFLGGTALLGVGAGGVAGLGRLLQRRFQIDDERAGLVIPPAASPAASPTVAGAGRPDAFELDLEGLTPFVTANDRFFRIDTALVVPQVSVDEWQLRIHGLVEREIVLDFDDLLGREQVERYVTISCVSNEVGGGLIGNARWQGVLLADVLREAGVDPSAEQLVSRSFDGWTCGTPVSAVLDGRDALLAYAMNGEPLPDRHGYPVRMVVPGLFGYVSATKWVTDIELTTWDAFDAYWVTRGWAEQAPVKTMARIDRPRRDSTWPGGPLDVAGVAWAVHRGISAVEVRIDDGPWQECELAGVPSDDTWRQWRLRWEATPGEHVVEARAVDGEGVPQPSEPRPPAPDGAQGYHRVRFRVE